ncbi:MAG: SDR family NAD(P)-dependent oxidoreductase, partial [bacterium]|nr:SDR family NAD(P)-dependent oxidoreductase [bacterium]
KDGEKDPLRILSAIQKYAVTHINFVPSMFSVFLGALETEGTAGLASLKYIFLAGEALLPSLVERYRRLKLTLNTPGLTGTAAPGLVGVENIYGPTEATIYAGNYSLSRWPAASGGIPIGEPMQNLGLYILDKYGNLQPVGVTGELCITGVGLARGYLGRPELTAEKFLPNPYAPGERLYKTGDKARWLADGNIEYLGRFDHQVKIRGFRIESGEIENRLLKHQQIKEAVVITQKDGNGNLSLCACIVTADGIIAPASDSRQKKETGTLETSQLRNFLAAQLPEYMIPSTFVKVEAIPLTPNGKVDKKALALEAKKSGTLGTGNKYSAPRNQVEKIISRQWKEILKQDQVGIDDNFFDAGGNSLNLIQLNTKLKKVFSKEIPVTAMLKYPTIRTLARSIIGGEDETKKDVVKETPAKTVEKHKHSGAIAVIGMAGRFPGSQNIEQFWDNLKNGIETITFFSENELIEAGIPRQMVEKPNYVKAKGALEEFEYFDYGFFGYSPGEACIMDPQFRYLHETVWEALENGGYAAGIGTQKIGLYAGANDNYLWLEQLKSGITSSVDQFAAMFLNIRDFLATRIAYKLNLQGPVLTVQTACSTSLVAIDTACQALLSGKCDMALAGGVAISYPGKSGYFYEEGMIYSPDGHCRTFDSEAKGTLRGDGVGIVLLKTLEEAEADGDNIYAVIKGSAVNNDGIGKAGYTAPGIEGQAAVIKAAQQAAGVEAGTIGYIEAHGTATELGDPAEIEALIQAFNLEKRATCAVGSVKTNLGHLDAAAGVTGFIKTVLALKHRQIPPSLHFKTPNPAIDFDNSPFYVNAKLSKWKNDTGPLRAGVSSLGIGGTNAHVVLEEWTPPPPPKQPHNAPLQEREYKLILLSAKTEATLDRAAENLARYLENNPGTKLDDAAYTLQVGREAFQYRRKYAVENIPKAIEALTAGKNGERPTQYVKEKNKPVVFIYPGLGAQYVNMALELYRQEPVFREEMDRCFQILEHVAKIDIKRILYPGETPGTQPKEGNNEKEKSNRREELSQQEELLRQIDIAQLSVFILEYALTKMLTEFGIKPRAVIGYSFGEYAAASAAGIFSLEDALKLIAARGRLLREIPPGAMLSVPLPPEELHPLLNEDISIAVDNKTSCVLSGPVPKIEAFEKAMKEKKYLCMRIKTTHALHSQMMDPLLAEFERELREITLKEPRIPIITGAASAQNASGQAAAPTYWVKQMRETVHFAAGMKTLLAKDDTIFVEVGPGHDLSALVKRYISEIPTAAGHQVLELVRAEHRKISDSRILLNRIGHMWCRGAAVDWNGFNTRRKRQRIPLPTYPFDRRLCRPEKKWEYHVQTQEKKQPLKKQDIADWFYLPSWEQTHLIPAIPTRNQEKTRNRNWLLFTDNSGMGDRLREKLVEKEAHVVTVRQGRAYAKIKDREYTIEPTAEKDYISLLEELSSTGKQPDRVVHLWSLDSYKDNGENGKKLDYGYYSLLYLAKAVGTQPNTGTIRLEAISSGIQDVTGIEPLEPAKATLLGVVKVIPQEYTQIRSRCIDIELPQPGSPQEENIAQRIMEELEAPQTDTVIAYRNRYRWKQIYSPLRLEENIKRETLLKEKGVYLITGGLGGIGLLLAHYLAETVKARLVLTGRSPFPPPEEWDRSLKEQDETAPLNRKIKKLQDIIAKGGEVLAVTADAADRQQMQDVVDTAEKQWGPINGIIHAAAIIGETTFQPVHSLTKNETQRQFRPKIEGIQVLTEIVRQKEHPPDFCFAMSSTSAILGGLGFAAYSAANIYIDTFVRKHNRGGGVPWTTVNWEAWQVEEKHETTPISTALGANLAEIAMTPEEGVETLLRALSSGVTQLVHSPEDLHSRLEKWIQLQTLGESRQQKTHPSIHKRPELTNPYKAPSNQVEQTLAGIWKALFGFEEIGVQDDFFELGGDSLKAISVIASIHKALNTQIQLDQFFKNPTIEGLAALTAGDGESTYAELEPVEKMEYYVLSSAQKRLYILQQMEQETISYNEPQILVMEGKPDIEKMRATFIRLIKRHESLRTTIENLGNQPVQKIHDNVAFEIEYYDLEAEAKPGKEPNPYPVIKRFIRPFLLTQAPLLRVGLIKIRSGEHLLMLDMHHLVTDGISSDIFIKDFMALYTGEKLPPLRIQYKDYAQWQQNEKGKEKLIKQEKYWLEELAGEIPELRLPLDFSRPQHMDFAGSTLHFSILEKETRELKKLVLAEGATIYMALLALFNILLAKLTRQEDIVVGTPTAGRRHTDLEHIIGMFVNTL